MLTGNLEITCTSCNHTLTNCSVCNGHTFIVNDIEVINAFKASAEFENFKNEIYQKAQETAEKNYAPTLIALNTSIGSLKKELVGSNALNTKYQEKLAEMDKVIEEAKERANQNALQMVENEKLKFQLELNKNKVMNDSLSKKVSELEQKLKQGSIQSQGEAGEELVKENLTKNFSDDIIEDIAKGKRGADLVQKVKMPDGADVTSMLFEVKNTTTSFSSSWPTKAKEDQQEMGAGVVIIVTRAMPKGITHFGFVDGVLVTSFHCYLPLVALIRQHLITLYQMKQISDVKDGTPSLLYEYITGDKFTKEFETLFEIYSDSKDDLDKEKKTVQKFWNSREQLIGKLLTSVTTLYVDCKEIVGNALPVVDGLE